MFFVGYFFTSKFYENSRRVNDTQKILFNSKLGKTQSIVNVQLESLFIPRSPTDVAHIRAYITLLRSSNGKINYTWTLPEKAQIIEGDKSGTLENMNQESPISIEIKIAGFSSSEKEILTLSAQTELNSLAYSGVGLISSKPEESFEHLVTNRTQEGLSGSLDLSSESPNTKIQSNKKIKIQR